ATISGAKNLFAPAARSAGSATSARSQKKADGRRAASGTVEVSNIWKNQRQIALADAEPQRQFRKKFIAACCGYKAPASGVQRVGFRTILRIQSERRIGSVNF